MKLRDSGWHETLSLLAPSFLVDADDTAKTILALNNERSAVGIEPMINHFKSSKGHVSTYIGERNASFSANCNALQAMLKHQACKDHQHIVDVLEYLCEAWRTADVRDKWVGDN